jgi:hypothetical protein
MAYARTALYPQYYGTAAPQAVAPWYVPQTVKITWPTLVGPVTGEIPLTKETAAFGAGCFLAWLLLRR